MRKLFVTLLALVMLTGTVVPVSAASQTETNQELDRAITRAATYLLRTVDNPQVGSVGGEWAVLGLARSSHPVPDAYFEQYFRTVERYVRQRNGVLDTRRLTEYSRVILALTAAGFNPTNVAGFDLTESLLDFDQVIWQGINGPVFALLAIDSLNYYSIHRNRFITEILRRQTSDGGWNLSAGTNNTPVAATEVGDPDITGMALQALAKYQNNPRVVAATNRALDFLSSIQNDNGGFGSVESSAQVLVALTELGIDVNDPRFVKNGNNLIDNILTFQNADGSFRHRHDRDGNNLMATEQAFYALVSAQRAAEGLNSLYRMDDRTVRYE